MKIVAGFQGLDAVGGEVLGLERRERGIREAQKVGWATRGRLDSCASRRKTVAENRRERICFLAQLEHRFAMGRIALTGAMMVLQ